MTRQTRNPGAWPALMTAPTAAAYVDEPSVEAFLRRAGKVYPAGRTIQGRGRVWAKGELDTTIAHLTEQGHGGLAGDL